MRFRTCSTFNGAMGIVKILLENIIENRCLSKYDGVMEFFKRTWEKALMVLQLLLICFTISFFDLLFLFCYGCFLFGMDTSQYLLNYINLVMQNSQLVLHENVEHLDKYVIPRYYFIFLLLQFGIY